MELVENDIDTHVPVGVGSAELKRARPRKYSSVMFSKGKSLKTTGYPTMATTTQLAARQTTLSEGACVQGCRHLKRHGVLGSSGHVRLLTELT